MHTFATKGLFSLILITSEHRAFIHLFFPSLRVPQPLLSSPAVVPVQGHAPAPGGAAVGPADASQTSERLLPGHSRPGRGPGAAVTSRHTGSELEARSPLGVPPSAAWSGMSGRGPPLYPGGAAYPRGTPPASFVFSVPLLTWGVSRNPNYDCFLFIVAVLLQIIAIANCSLLERNTWTWAFVSLIARYDKWPEIQL